MGTARTLAIHPGALGDVLLAVPALRALRAHGSVTLAAQPRIGALLLALGVVDAAVAVDSLGLDALFVDDPTSRPRLPASDRLVCWFGARDAVFPRRLREFAAGAIVAPPASAGRLVWEHLLATVQAPAGDWCAPLAVPDELGALGTTTLVAAGMDGPRPWLFVHPGAGSAAKQWPAEGFARVISATGARTRLNTLAHQGPADAAAAAALRRHVGDGVVWLREPSLPALAGALTQAQVFLGNDSGVSHLAAALGVPSVVLFDARHLAWRPWGPGARVHTVTLTRVVDAELAAVAHDVAAALG